MTGSATKTARKRLTITKDFLSGLLFIGIGAFAFILALNFRLGTLREMGPGFFPLVLSGLSVVLGCVIAVKAIARPDTSEAVAEWEVRPLLAITASIIAFSLLVRPAGLVVAIAATVVISRLSRRDGNIWEMLALIAVLSLGAVLIFSYGLRLSLKVWPV